MPKPTIVQTLSAKLEREFGRGFAPRNMHRMLQFCQSFTDRQKVSTLSTQLSWCHFVELLPLGDRLKYAFYTEMCRIERWRVHTLRDQRTTNR